VTRELSERGLDALLVTNLVNVRYLTGFGGTSGLCVVSEGDRFFMTDFRYTERAEREVAPTGFERVEAGREALEQLAERMGRAGFSRVGFDDAHLTVRQHGRYADKLTGIELVPAAGVVEGLRAVKEEGELAAIRAASALADEVYGLVPERGLAGRTEREVANELEHEMRLRGAEPSFPSIVAGGANGALPHAEPGADVIPRDALVVLDMGCRLDGYCSDCTRTFATGRLSDDASAVYDLVRAAQQAALEAVAPGASAAAVDSVARELITAAGHGERFGHGLGHGVGLEVHEEPRVSQAAEGELEPGNVVTVEPGVYVAGELGVRIEDLVAVTASGHEVISGFTKDLVTVA